MTHSYSASDRSESVAPASLCSCLHGATSNSCLRNESVLGELLHLIPSLLFPPHISALPYLVTKIEIRALRRNKKHVSKEISEGIAVEVVVAKSSQYFLSRVTTSFLRSRNPVWSLCDGREIIYVWQSRSAGDERRAQDWSGKSAYLTYINRVWWRVRS